MPWTAGSPATWSSNLGTGAQVIDPRTGPPTGSGWSDVHVYEGVLGDHYSMVAAQNAGLALSWAQHQLGISWDELSVICQQAPPGAGGVLFSPFVAPERGALSPTRSGPGWISEEMGNRPPTTLAARAAAEAQAFLVRRSWELLDVDARRVFVLGGGARRALGAAAAGRRTREARQPPAHAQRLGRWGSDPRRWADAARCSPHQCHGRPEGASRAPGRLSALAR